MKPGMSTDGDALFRNAMLSVSRSDKPRDGGLACGVLFDWVKEYLEENPWVALCDWEGTGFLLVVAKANGIQASVLDPEGDTCRCGRFNDEELFKKGLPAVLRWLWE